MQYTLFVILAPLAAITSIAAVVYIWGHRAAPGALALMGALIAVTGWLILNTLELVDPTEAGTVLWAKVEYPFFASAPVAWLLFALQYTGRNKWLTPRRIALLFLVPLMVSFLALTNDGHHLIWKSYVFTPINNWLAMNVVAYGPWFWVHIIYSYSMVFVGAFIIVREYFQSWKPYRQQSVWSVVGAIVPIVFNIVYVFHLIPGFRKDYSSVSYALSGLAFSMAILRYQLFDLKPVARNALIESMSDGMLALDERNRIVDVNRTAQDILGIPLATAIGQPAAQVLSPWQDLVDRFGDKLAAQAEISLNRGETQRHYDLRISPLNDQRGRFSGRLIVLRDMTESKEAEIALRESEEKLRQITSSMREAVWLRDTRTLEILYVNPAYEEIWGRTRESFYQNPTSFLDAVHPEDKARVMEAIQNQYRGIPFDQEYRIIRPDGSVRWIWGRTFFIKNETGETYRVMALAEDITERKQAADALRQANLELQARNQELDTFGHTVAHDLKGPLGTIIGYAELIAEANDTLSEDELRQSVQTIAQVGLKMDRILEELMLLAGLRSVQVEMEPIAMAAMLADVKQRLTLMVRQYHAEVVWPDGSVWPEALGHGPWVEEVWVNYLSNAIKYGGRPPRVELGATPISFSPAREEDREGAYIRFWVRDNGPGLSPDEQARLFNPFVRIDQTRVTGHGLGLSIVRRIVEKMGGQVSVESARVPGHGSTFCFTLPATE